MAAETNLPAQDTNQIIEERRAKLKALREKGIAFPNDFQRGDLAAELHASYGEKTNEALEAVTTAVAVAGFSPTATIRYPCRLNDGSRRSSHANGLIRAPVNTLSGWARV